MFPDYSGIVIFSQLHVVVRGRHDMRETLLRRERIRSKTAPGHEGGHGDQHQVDRDIHWFVAPGVNDSRTHHYESQPDRC
jgi:hypothetical protein